MGEEQEYKVTKEEIRKVTVVYLIDSRTKTEAKEKIMTHGYHYREDIDSEVLKERVIKVEIA